jgi:hypothetical protein
MPNGRHPFHPDISVTRGVLEQECRELMVKFFRRRRNQAKEAKAAAAAAAAATEMASRGVDSGDSSCAVCCSAGDGMGQQGAQYLGSAASDSEVSE